VLVAGDAAFFANPADTKASLAGVVIFIVAAYVTGQIVGQVAGWLLEVCLLDKTTVGFPSVNLLVRREPRDWPMQIIFSEYWRPFSPVTRDQILKTAHGLKLSQLPLQKCFRGSLGRRSRCAEWCELANEGEALFQYCYGTLNRQGLDSGRLANQLNVYAFCRNMSIALLLGASALVVGEIVGTPHTGRVSAWWYVGGAVIGAVILFLRYLKMFRLFHEEILTSYAGQAAEQ
jgi:hypothetical protein